MVSPIFGVGKKVIHDKRVAYDHSCGDVQPGDDFTENISEVTCDKCKTKFKVHKVLYIIETGEREVLITTDRSQYPGSGPIIKDGHLLSARSLTSDAFQWSYIDAYLNDKEASWQVTMDEGAQAIWDSRPEGFENRAKQAEHHPVEEYCPCCGRGL